MDTHDPATTINNNNDPLPPPPPPPPPSPPPLPQDQDPYLNDNREQVEMDMDEKSDSAGSPSGQNNGDTLNQIVDINDNNPRGRHDHSTIREEAKNGGREGGDRDDRHTRFDTTIIQVTNIAPTATLDQVKTLFGFLGDIVNIELFNSSDQEPETKFKVCFVEYAKSSSVHMAQHLTNTVFIDRALIVLPYKKRKMPDKATVSEIVANSNLETNFNYGVVSQVVPGVGGLPVIATIDPRLAALNLPQYPQLPTSTDPTRVEEIRRTVYIGNLDSTLLPDQVMKFFNDIGEVKYIRMAGDDTQPTRFAFVEFTHQSSIADALQHNGFVLGSRSLKINHSNNAIVKPQPKVDMDDLSKRLRDNHSASRDSGTSRDRHHPPRYGERGIDRDRNRDRDRYHDRRLSPREPRYRRSRSRDGGRRRSRSRDRASRRSRSRDKTVKRSRSRDTRRRRSRSKSSEHSRSRHHKSSRSILIEKMAERANVDSEMI